MKKTFFVFLSMAFVLGVVSCQKEQTVVTPEDNTTPEPTEPTYQEGVFAPLMKIASIDREEGICETWTWNGDLLTSVTNTDGDTRGFTYANGRLAQVTGSMSNLFGIIPGVAGTVAFSYNGTLFKNCTVTSSGTDVVLATFGHSGDRVSYIDLALDAEYISGMLDGLLTGGKGSRLDPKQILLDTTDNSIHVDMVWNGKDVSQVIVAGDIPFALTKEMYQTIKPFLPVDSSMLALVDLYFILSNTLPMNINVADTIDYTYDNKFNPYFCYFGDINPSCLSLHNILSSNNHGSVSISVTLTSSPMQVTSQPINDRKVFFYEYNDRNYPTTVEGSDNYTITYKQ